MIDSTPALSAGDTPLQPTSPSATGGYVELLGERFYRIGYADALDPFFISLVSASDHWLFIASSGGLTAGRVNAERALFPYYTVDKLTENSENTGAKTVIVASRNGRRSLWEPWSDRYRGIYRIERNLYKNIPGTALVFEEINHTLALSFRAAWRAGERFGFARTAWLANLGSEPCDIDALDGLQNLMPPNATPDTQNTMSALLDAYKRAEADPETGLGLFYLNASLSDMAEPSESLLATTVAVAGLKPDAVLVSARQLDRFRAGSGVEAETEARGLRGAYFVRATLSLAPGAERSWHLIADVAQDHDAIARLARVLREDSAGLPALIDADLAANRTALLRIVAAADGAQTTASELNTAHHFANVMFNVMRGGTFIDGYQVDSADFAAYAAVRNRAMPAARAAFFASLPKETDIFDLRRRAAADGDPDLIGLADSYLPLSFSRRHGDPSRPWNRFSINLRNPDGSRRLDYEGNWRDIFQNWEALAWSYPEYLDGMIHVFLGATTVDGYNPYRVTRAGVDWEVHEPGNPWGNFGYWSDHQIIYLQKLLETRERFHPGALAADLNRPRFTSANVPYRIKPYADLVKDAANTLVFDQALEREIEAAVKARGTEARLVAGPDGRPFRQTMTEKLLTLLLAKLANFVPGGGIWMNTQRPEWNDANNALVGKGLSVVTLGYLRRFVAFFRDLLAAAPDGDLDVGVELEDFRQRVADILAAGRAALAGGIDDTARRAVMNALGEAGSRARWAFYERGLSGRRVPVARAALGEFLDVALAWIDPSLRDNARDDGLYHAYNTLRLGDGTATIRRLPIMLEGQVSILSSQLLSGDESVALLDALSGSALYEPAQRSYLLYPNRKLPGFRDKNTLDPASVARLRLPAALAAAGDRRLFTRDLDGAWHFSGRLRNARDVERTLAALRNEPAFASLAAAEGVRIHALFEATFDHESFTGRSGTFFAYEGLGSIYWHMVSKLLLAVQETLFRCRTEAAAPALRARYAEIRAGLGANKTPAEYGAFPTDPYSHTPSGQGAKQPGMTGMVKEEILTRLGELGVAVVEGRLGFDFLLLDRTELLSAAGTLADWDIGGRPRATPVPKGSLAFTVCQTPVIVTSADRAEIRVTWADGRAETLDGHQLDARTSARLFRRTGEIARLDVGLPGARSI